MNVMKEIDKEIYDNLIFIMPPTTFSDVYNDIGKPKEEFNDYYSKNDRVISRIVSI